MLRSLSRGVRFTALLSMLSSGYGLAQRQTPVPARTTPVQTAEPRYKTPADKVLIPYLKAHLKASALTSQSVRSKDATNYVTAPNFGGYVNAPAYNARTSASLGLGVFDTGVTAEVTADFDKDGKPDIAVFQQDGTLNILLNDGKGGLQAPVSYLNPNYMTSSVNNAYAVDVNGDGNIDIIGYDVNNNTMITFLNLGKGTFNAAVTTALDTTNGYPNMVYVADVNGDGKADVIYPTSQFVSRTSAIVYLEVQLGAGDGTFGTPAAAKVQQFPLAASVQLPSSGGIAVADLNGDGKMDIAIALDERFSQTTGQYVVTTALGNGDGTFSALNTTLPISVPAVSTGPFPVVSYSSTGIFLTDVNGDGKVDVVSDINGVLEAALGAGAGTFAAPVTSDFSAVAQGDQSLVLDVNGDKIPDIVEVGGTLGVLIGKGDGTFAAPVASGQYVVDPAEPQGIIAGDFNGDGIADVALLGGDYKQISLFFGNATGGFRGAPLITAESDPNGIFTSMLTSGKYTASGYLSPLFSYAGPTAGELVTGVSDGKGNFSSVQALAGGVPSDLEYVEPIHADFNGDGLEDLVYANTTGDIFVALAKGDGSFATPVSAGLPATACPVYYGAAGDINGDGKIDLVIPYGGDQACGSSAGGATGYYVSLGKGDGTFSAPVFTATGTELYSLVLADINKDGKLDLLINDVPFVVGSGFQLSTAVGNGDGTFGLSSVVVQNYLLSNVVVADINNDGNPDLVLSSEEVVNNDVSTGGILLITGNGDGSFNTPSQIATGNFFYGLEVADMNHDGNADIVATLFNTPAQPVDYYGMVTLLGYGNGQFSGPFNELESLASTLPQVGSFVNDGAVDVMTETGYGPGLFIGQGGSTLALTASAGSITFGTAETLTATLTAGLTGRPAATGNVSFYDGTTLLGAAALSSGTATFSAAALATGPHSVTAVYAGDSNFNPNTSAAATITVAALTPGFALTGTPGTVTITGGAQGVVTLNLAANASFSGAVTLSCSGLPADGNCSINPGSVTLTAGGSSTATLVIGTTGTHAELKRTTNPWEGTAAVVSLATLCGVFFGRRKHVRLLGVLGLALLLSVGTLITGCSDGGSNKSTTAPTLAPGTYSVTVTATPVAGSTASVQTTTVSVTVN